MEVTNNKDNEIIKSDTINNIKENKNIFIEENNYFKEVKDNFENSYEFKENSYNELNDKKINNVHYKEKLSKSESMNFMNPKVYEASKNSKSIQDLENTIEIGSIIVSGNKILEQNDNTESKNEILNNKSNVSSRQEQNKNINVNMIISDINHVFSVPKNENNNLFYEKDTEIENEKCLPLNNYKTNDGNLTESKEKELNEGEKKNDDDNLEELKRNLYNKINEINQESSDDFYKHYDKEHNSSYYSMYKPSKSKINFSDIPNKSRNLSKSTDNLSYYNKNHHKSLSYLNGSSSSSMDYNFKGQKSYDRPQPFFEKEYSKAFDFKKNYSSRYPLKNYFFSSSPPSDYTNWRREKPLYQNNSSNEEKVGVATTTSQETEEKVTTSELPPSSDEVNEFNSKYKLRKASSNGSLNDLFEYSNTNISNINYSHNPFSEKYNKSPNSNSTNYGKSYLSTKPNNTFYKPKKYFSYYSPSKANNNSNGNSNLNNNSNYHSGNLNSNLHMNSIYSKSNYLSDSNYSASTNSLYSSYSNASINNNTKKLYHSNPMSSVNLEVFKFFANNNIDYNNSMDMGEKVIIYDISSDEDEDEDEFCDESIEEVETEEDRMGDFEESHYSSSDITMEGDQGMNNNYDNKYKKHYETLDEKECHSTEDNNQSTDSSLLTNGQSNPCFEKSIKINPNTIDPNYFFNVMFESKPRIPENGKEMDSNNDLYNKINREDDNENQHSSTESDNDTAKYNDTGLIIGNDDLSTLSNDNDSDLNTEAIKDKSFKETDGFNDDKAREFLNTRWLIALQSITSTISTKQTVLPPIQWSNQSTQFSGNTEAWITLNL
ncbi:hypothetical protein BCR36DRAFT_578862, partial [Piromyces finnis]